MGRYILIEGIDGSGKDLQADLLCKRLSNPCRVSEPDATLPTGALLRQLMKAGVSTETHAALFLANRLQVMTEKVQPALEAGQDVVSARSWMSNLVYQQDFWPLHWLMDLHRQLPCQATHLILLDMDPEAAMARLGSRGGHLENYERLETQKRNRQRYLDLIPLVGPFMSSQPKILVAHAEAPPEEVSDGIWSWLEGL